MTSRRLLQVAFQALQPGNISSSFPRFNYSSFKSSISLDKLYPNSDLTAFSTNPQPPENTPTKFSGIIPMDKVPLVYSRSSGPGGQNVNKVNTKVSVTFKVADALWIPDIIRKHFEQKFRNQITREGTICVQSDRTRYQHLNTADALQKLREMIRSCEPVVVVHDPADLEKARRLREKAARERLLVKRIRSNVKSSRGAV